MTKLFKRELLEANIEWSVKLANKKSAYRLPGEMEVDASQRAAARFDRMQFRQLLVQEYGPGAVQ